MPRRGDIAMTKSANSKTAPRAQTKPAPESHQDTPKPRKKPSNFDFRWIAVIMFMISALAAAVFLNTEHNADDTQQLMSGLDIDNSDLKINWERYPTTDLELTEPITITQSGTYHVTGFIYNGGIIVDAGIGEVKLIIDNVIIDNPTGPAIYCKSAEDLVIELTGNNSLSDGETYATEYDEDVTGVIYTKSDLIFEGDGALTINANYQDAIVGKDDVKFKSGNYTISSIDDAIRGKDSVYIVGGNFTINTGADAIKSTNYTDRTKGFILIESGAFNLSTTIGKGIKATNYIVLSGGKYNLNTFDDAIHSDNFVSISDGTIDIVSGDDGIHANNKVTIDGGQVTISKSYEGIEAQAITINNGNISVIAADDGINAGGGADGSANNRKGSSPFEVDANCIIAINGGKLYVNSTGDGIDSNGFLYINGGETRVDGPTDNGNGALDATGGITMSGGNLLAVGASGMAEAPTLNSTTNSISVYLASIQPANTKITITDQSGAIILDYTASKQFSHFTFGDPMLKIGNTYTIYLNDVEYQTVTQSSVTTTVGRDSNFQRQR